MENVDEKDLVQCPYDVTHRILKSRIQVHLKRCAKNHPHLHKVTCPFDTTHILNKSDLELHVTVCPERKSFEHFKNKNSTASTPNVPQPILQNNDEENWDDDPDVPAYNPQAYVSKANIVRNIQGAPPSVRKQFRAQERLRLLGIKK